MKNDNEYLHSLYSFFVSDVFLDAVKQIFLWYNVYVKIRHLDKRHRQSEHRLQEICCCFPSESKLKTQIIWTVQMPAEPLVFSHSCLNTAVRYRSGWKHPHDAAVSCQEQGASRTLMMRLHSYSDFNHCGSSVIEMEKECFSVQYIQYMLMVILMRVILHNSLASSMENIKGCTMWATICISLGNSWFIESRYLQWRFFPQFNDHKVFEEY